MDLSTPKKSLSNQGDSSQDLLKQITEETPKPKEQTLNLSEIDPDSLKENEFQDFGNISEVKEMFEEEEEKEDLDNSIEAEEL